MNSKKSDRKALCIWVGLMLVFLAGSVMTGKAEEKENLREAMRDAVLHEANRISLFGAAEVNPAFISALIMTGILLLAAILIRLFIIPKFTYVPGKFQLVLETAVSYFDNLAKTNSPHKNGILGGYIFAAGTYICLSTVFELFGVQAISTAGKAMSLPAPLSDINAAIAMGVLSYLFIMSGGISANGIKGIGLTLKEFSLPISMSFRLFGALLSGLLVTELVYHVIFLSFVFPVLVGIMFTLMHALIQAYVLTLLVAIFYGEVSEPHHKKEKRADKNKNIEVEAA